jgi:hypothetical protein
MGGTLKIHIETAPFETLRNKQVDDYWYDSDGTLQIRVAEELSDERRQHAVIIHALWEALTCRHTGVIVQMIDWWDEHFQTFGLPPTVEAGDDPQCPYYRQHQMATIIERLFIEETGDNWQEYEKEVESL